MITKIGLIGAMDCEVYDFIRTFHAEVTDIPGIYKGTSGNKEIYISSSGVGKVNAAIAAERLIDRFGVEALINSGVAGGLDRRLSKADVVVSDALTYHDFNPAELLESYAPHTRFFKADERLRTLAVEACGKLNKKLESEGKAPFSVYTGTIVSGDCFVSSNEQAEHLQKTFGAMCTEMEGAAIAHAALVNGLPFVVIRAISDFADDDAENSFEAFTEVAAQRAAFITGDIIASL